MDKMLIDFIFAMQLGLWDTYTTNQLVASQAEKSKLVNIYKHGCDNIIDLRMYDKHKLLQSAII